MCHQSSTITGNKRNMKLMFDIGYNKGEFTDQYLLLYPDCTIIGVEANPELITTRHTNVYVLNNIVSDKDGETKRIHIAHESGISTEIGRASCRERV